MNNNSQKSHLALSYLKGSFADVNGNHAKSADISHNADHISTLKWEENYSSLSPNRLKFVNTYAYNSQDSNTL